MIRNYHTRKVVLSIFILVVLLSACVPIQTSQTPNPVNSVTDYEKVISTTESEILRTFSNIDKSQTIQYRTSDWKENTELSQEGLESLTINTCRFYLKDFTFRDNFNNSKPIIDFSVAGKDFKTQIDKADRFKLEPEYDISYLIIHEHSDPIYKTLDSTWKLEMLSNEQNAEVCFEAIQPLLASLVVGTGEIIGDPGQYFEWDKNDRERYCKIESKNEIFLIPYEETALIFTKSTDSKSINQITISNEEKPFIQSQFTAGKIDFPIFLEGDNLIYLDTEKNNYKGEWKVLSYNFKTKIVKSLFSDTRIQPSIAQDIHLAVTDNAVYISYIEGVDGSNLQKSTIVKVDIKTADIENVFSILSENIKIGKISAGFGYLMAEQVTLNEDANSAQPLILIRLEKGFPRIDFDFIGSDPILTDNGALWMNSPANTIADSFSAYSHNGSFDAYKFNEAPGTNIQHRGITTTWQSVPKGEDPRNSIFSFLISGNLFVIHATEENTNLSSPIPTSIRPIFFPMKVDIGKDAERYALCVFDPYNSSNSLGK